MCLAIPGKVLSIDRAVSPVMGEVSFGGVKKRVCLEWVPEVVEGQYVIVHVGFALSSMNEAEALETIRLLEQMGDLGEEIGGESTPDGSPPPLPTEE